MRKRFTRPQKMVIVTGILSIVFVIDIQKTAAPE